MSKTMVCPLCGGELINKGEDVAQDIDAKYKNDTEAMVTYLHCQQCGRDFNVFDPTEEERQSIDYWK